MDAEAVDLGPRKITCFKAYDVRGRVGVDLDADIAYRIGRAFAEVRRARLVVVGRDSRESSPALQAALMKGLTDGGADVRDLGLAGTEEVYFATPYFGADGGIEVTASHNPVDYNGMKLVARDAVPLDPVEDSPPIIAAASSGRFAAPARRGQVLPAGDARAAYVRRVVDFIDVTALRSLRIVVNAGNGSAGPTFDAIAAELERRGAPLEFIRINHAVDPSFPNGVPNPLLDANHAMTAEPVRREGGDLGIAWDGDFDRCFFFDAAGRFIPGEYITGLLASALLADHPGEKIVHDTRVVMNTRGAIAEGGGTAVPSRSGHTFLKQAMRASGAIYGGEMSAHHYFRDFHFADSGMIPWLLVVELISRKGQGLAAMLDDRIRRFPSSGESNYRIADPIAAIARVVAHYQGCGATTDDLDGISLDFGDWRFNLRQSNTEPLVRLNVEGREDRAEVMRRRDEIAALLMAD